MREWIERRVQTGQYASPREHVSDLDRRDHAQAAKRTDELRDKIASGLASLRAENSIGGEAFLAELDADLATQERNGF